VIVKVSHHDGAGGGAFLYTFLLRSAAAPRPGTTTAQPRASAAAQIKPLIFFPFFHSPASQVEAGASGRPVESADDLCRHYDFASGLNASSNNILFIFSGPISILSENYVAFLQLYIKSEIQLLGKPMLMNYADAQELCIPGTMVRCGEKFQTVRCHRQTDSRSGRGLLIAGESILEFWPPPVITLLLVKGGDEDTIYFR
jgi:hypothetical protein